MGLSVVELSPIESRRQVQTAPRAAVTEHAAVLVVGFPGVLGSGLSEQIGRDDSLYALPVDETADLPSVIDEQRPDVVLIWSDALAGVLELRALVLARPATRVAVIVPRSSAERDEALIAAGAVVLPLTMDADDLRSALRLLARGVVGPPRVAPGSPTAALSQLTVRETQVLRLLLERRLAAEVARALYVSEATVKSHTRSIYNKLGVHSRRELALRAQEIMGAGRAWLGS